MRYRSLPRPRLALVVSLPLLFLAAQGCRFDTGAPYLPPNVDGPPWVPDGGDGAIDARVAGDGPTPVEPDLVAPDTFYQPGKSCTADAGQMIIASAIPVAGSRVTLTIHTAAAVWVMAGIAPGTKPLDGEFTWKGGVSDSSCSNGQCVYQIPHVEVPEATPPYTFGFMKNAWHDDWTKGQIVFTCVP